MTGQGSEWRGLLASFHVPADLLQTKKSAVWVTAL
jgi:hypothetical protein